MRQQRATASQDTRERVSFHTRVGELYEEQLNQTDDAIRVYRRIFDELEPSNEDAIQALARIYSNVENWNELKVVNLRELENAVGDVQEAEAVRVGRARLAPTGFFQTPGVSGENGRFIQLYGGSGGPAAGVWFSLTKDDDLYSINPGQQGLISGLPLGSFYQ